MWFGSGILEFPVLGRVLRLELRMFTFHALNVRCSLVGYLPATLPLASPYLRFGDFELPFY